MFAGAAGIVYGGRAALSHWLYHRVKYGAERDLDAAAILRRGETAFRLYPFSYHLCEFMAETAWEARFGEGGAVRDDMAAAANDWCRRGLVLNRRSRRLNELAARGLALRSPAASVAFWRKYVQWDFWQPDNHAVLADLQIGAGDYAGALDSLRWAARSTHHERVLRRLRAAWRREREAPPQAPP